MTCGIYEIKNTETGEVYIGQSKDIEDRIRHHKMSLKSGRSSHTPLQNSWDMYGENSFDFGVLEECRVNKLDEYEMEYIREVPEDKRLNTLIPRSCVSTTNTSSHNNKVYPLRIPSDLHKKLKIQAVKEERDMRDILLELIKMYLNN